MPNQNTKSSLRVEVSDRQITFWLSAPTTQKLLLDPHSLLEDETGARVAHLTLPAPDSEDGPKGALVIPAGREVRLAVWTGEIDLPALPGQNPRAVLEESGPDEPGPGERRVFAPPGRYRLTLFSFLQGEPVAHVEFSLPPSHGAARGRVGGLSSEDDASFVKAFLAEARLLREGCRIRPGRFSDADLAEMARLAEIPQIPAIHRELLLRVRRLQIADHDLVTPPILEEDLEVVRASTGEQDLFPWFSLKPYDREEFVCFDLNKGGLVHTLYRSVDPLRESPREYLLALLQQASTR